VSVAALRVMTSATFVTCAVIALVRGVIEAGRRITMPVSLDALQSLTEIKHALSKSFPYPSTSIMHVSRSDGAARGGA
jgi:hypothetical protein